MEYSGILVSRKALVEGYTTAGCLIDQAGQYRSVVDIALDTQLNNGGMLAPVAILYPNNTWGIGLAHVSPGDAQGSFWVYTPIQNLVGVACPGLSTAGLQTYDVTDSPEFDGYITGCVQQMTDFLRTNPELCGSYYTYEEFFSGNTLNQVLMNRQNEQQVQAETVQEPVQQAEPTQQPEPAQPEPQETVQEQAQGTVNYYTHEEPIEVGSGAHEHKPIAAVDFMTGERGKVEQEPAAEQTTSEPVEEQEPVVEQTASEPVEVQEPVQEPVESAHEVAQAPVAEPVEGSHIIDGDGAGGAPVEVPVQGQEQAVTNFSSGDKLKAMATDAGYNMEYKYAHINLAGMSCSMDEVKNHGPKDFKAPLTDIEKYVIKILSEGINTTFCEQPFLAYIDKHEDFKAIMHECADAFRHNDTSEFISRGEHSNTMRAYNALCAQLIRPSVLFPDIGDGRIINAEALDAISGVTGNMLYDMLSVNSRFLAVLLQMQVPVYQSYNGVYFQIYLSRMMHAINRVYAKLSEISLGSEEKLNNIFIEGTEEFQQMNEYTVGQLLSDIDVNVMLSYMKTTTGIVGDDGDDDDDAPDSEDGNVQVSWTTDNQIALGAISFLVNEMIKNVGVVTEFMRVNNGIVAQEVDGEKSYRRVYDTVSELISAYGYGRIPVSFPRGSLSFTQGLSMPDLKCHFLDTDIEFVYRDKTLLRDVVFYIAYTYNRTVNVGVDDVENGAVVEAFWDVVENSPRLKELLFGLAYTQTESGEISYVLGHAGVPIQNSVFASVVNGMDADSVDTFKLICSELYGTYVTQMFGDINQVDYDGEGEGTGRRRMSATEYYGYFKALWERAQADEGYNTEVLRRLMFGSERYLTLSMKESLIRTAYNLYDVQTLPADAVQNGDWCLALQHLLYSLTYGVDKEGFIPKTCGLQENVEAIYTSLWNIVPNTYGNNKYSLEQIMTLAKMEKIRHFKNGDKYNTARRELARKTESEVKKAEYENADDLMLIRANIKYDVHYVVDFAAVQAQIQANAGQNKNASKMVSATLGFVCSTGGNAATMEFLPVLGLRTLNTIAKYNYKFNITEQINNLYKAMRTGTPEGKALLKMFMNSNVLNSNLNKLGREVNEENSLTWLNDEIFSVLRLDLDKTMLSEEVTLNLKSGMFQGLSYADGSGKLGQMRIKYLNRKYLKYLVYVVKTLDPVPNKVFTIKYLPINLSETYKTEDNPDVKRYYYGEVQKAGGNGKVLEYCPFYAIKMVSNALTIIKTVQAALNRKTAGEFKANSILQPSSLLTVNDDCDEDGNKLPLWKSVVPAVGPGDDEYMNEMNMLTLAFCSIFQTCHRKVTIELK